MRIRSCGLTLTALTEGVLAMCRKTEEFSQEQLSSYFSYLDDLRESGVTNMFGAVPYLQSEFTELSHDRQRASQVLSLWMNERR